jgi:hypothetical protein
VETPKVARSGEEQPSSPATTEGESHIKAPPSTSEVARPSEVGLGRLLKCGSNLFDWVWGFTMLLFVVGELSSTGGSGGDDLRSR